MWIRTLTAAALFAVLAGVNTWVGTTEHLVLAVGYRAFLVAAPAFLFLGLAGGMKAALFLSFLASTASLFFFEWLYPRCFCSRHGCLGISCKICGGSYEPGCS